MHAFSRLASRPSRVFLRRGLLALFVCVLLVGVFVSSSSHAHAIDHLQDKSDIGRNKVPHRGTSHILVIPSMTGTQQFPPERWRALERYFDPEGGPGTFRFYWRTQSRGAYDPIPTLVQPVLYPHHCPIPGKSLNNCRFSITDVEHLFSGAVKTALTSLIERVRDEQGIDLSHFDVNGAEEGVPDGWFDGVIVSTDLFEGLGLPLAALGQELSIATTPRPPVEDDEEPADGGNADGGDDDGGNADAAGDAGSGEETGPTLSVGVMAFVPPDMHEFGHNLGFMDLYDGPAITDLMGREGSGLSAHSRLQIGWGTVQDVEGPMEIELAPVLEGGPILRFGQPPRYVLLENRSGFLHNQTETDFPGIYLYSIDENELPTGELGFLDIRNGDLYLPNRPEPRPGNLDCVERCYLNVNMPIGCRIASASEFDSCALAGDGIKRNIEHASDGPLGFYVEQLSSTVGGRVRLRIAEGTLAEEDAGPDAGTREDAGVGVDAGDEVTDGCQCTAAKERARLGAEGVFGAFLLLALVGRRRGRQA